MTTSTLDSTAQRPGLRWLLTGATVAFITSVSVLALFARLGWPGRHIAQWLAFCFIAWLTSIHGVPRTKWLVLGCIWACVAAANILGTRL